MYLADDLLGVEGKGSVSEQQLDVAGSLKLVRFHWPMCLVFVLFGLAVSAGYLILRPPLYTATSLVLLPGASSASNSATTPANDMTTAGEVATSSGILTPAAREVDPSLSPDVLRERVHAVGVATNVLSITADGMNGSQAESLANAVARNLVAFETNAGSATDQSALAGLRANAAQITRQINDLDAEIAVATRRLNAESASSAAGIQDAALIGALSTEETQASLQLDGVNSQIAQANLGVLATGQGTQVIQRATSYNPPSILHYAAVGIIGGLTGLFVGILLVLIRHHRDRHLRRRDEIAAAIGVPVLISMAAPSRLRSIANWTSLLSNYSPSAADRWSVQQALRDLESHNGVPANLIVLAVAGDTAGLAAAPQIAVVLSVLGIATNFGLSPGSEFAEPLRSACKRLSSRLVGLRPNLHVWSAIPPDDSNDTGVTVIGVAVDRDRPKLPLIRAAGPTILAASAGSATAEQLALVAIAAADAGMPIKGIVLTNPDVDDRTTGRFPEVAQRASLAPKYRALATREFTP